MTMKTNCKIQFASLTFAGSRLVFKGPEKPQGVPVEIKVPETKIVVTAKEIKEAQERLERLFKDYERRRSALLTVLEQFRQKDDLDLRLMATQHESRVNNETRDPAVLRSLRGVTEDDVKKQIDKIIEIANTALSRDEKLAVWMEARDREKIAEAVERYNYMREVNIAMVQNLKKHFWNSATFEAIMSALQEGLPVLKPEDIKDRQGVKVAIMEIQRIMERFKPQIDEARKFKHEQYEKAFTHAIGRVHDRNLGLLETDPRAFESAVAKMVKGVTEIPLDQMEAGEKWRITYEGLTFSMAPSGMGMSVALVDADEANRAKYGRLAEFLDERKTRGRTAQGGKKP